MLNIIPCSDSCCTVTMAMCMSYIDLTVNVSNGTTYTYTFLQNVLTILVLQSHVSLTPYPTYQKENAKTTVVVHHT